MQIINKIVKTWMSDRVLNHSIQGVAIAEVFFGFRMNSQPFSHASSFYYQIVVFNFFLIRQWTYSLGMLVVFDDIKVTYGKLSSLSWWGTRSSFLSLNFESCIWAWVGWFCWKAHGGNPPKHNKMENILSDTTYHARQNLFLQDIFGRILRRTLSTGTVQMSS